MSVPGCAHCPLSQQSLVVHATCSHLLNRTPSHFVAAGCRTKQLQGSRGECAWNVALRITPDDSVYLGESLKYGRASPWRVALVMSIPQVPVGDASDKAQGLEDLR